VFHLATIFSKDHLLGTAGGSSRLSMFVIAYATLESDLSAQGFLVFLLFYCSHLAPKCSNPKIGRLQVIRTHFKTLRNVIMKQAI
jgi:hypothetical protein